MAWADNLQNASFRGFIFDCLATDDKLARAHSVHSNPYADGAEIEDLGAEPTPINLNAIFYGPDYDTRLQAFIKLLNTPGIGELVHPVFGNINVQFIDCAIHHEADNVDQASLTLNFLQNRIAPVFFGQTLSVQKAQAISQLNTITRDAAAALLNASVQTISKTASFNRLAQLRTSMTGVLNQLKNQISGFISSGLDPLQFVSAWATDIAGAINGIVDLRNFDAGSLSADWKAVYNALGNAVLLPATNESSTNNSQNAAQSGVAIASQFEQPTAFNITTHPIIPIAFNDLSRQPHRDQSIIAALTALNLATGRADAASIVLISETQTPTLSTIEIQIMVAGARSQLQDVIDFYRALYPIETARAVTEPLKQTAYALHEAALAVIQARPPLVSRTMDAPGNLRLIAHKLYGDHTRALELFRLNPQSNTPNFIDRGDMLNAYAQ